MDGSSGMDGAKQQQRTCIGYARVSTTEQTVDPQVDALRKAGCVEIFADAAVSGAQKDRPELAKALAFVRPDEDFVVWKLDRLGRSLPHLIETVSALKERGVGFVSLTEAIDTSTMNGRLVFHIFGALAEFERDLIRERTAAGLKSARAKGRLGGRPHVITADKARKAEKLLKAGLRVPEVATRLKVGKSSLYAAIKAKTISIESEVCMPRGVC